MLPDKDKYLVELRIKEPEESVVQGTARLMSNQAPGHSIAVAAVGGGMMSSYRKPIPFRAEMQGTALIVTEERRVLERIFQQLMDLRRNKG